MTRFWVEVDGNEVASVIQRSEIEPSAVFQKTK